MEGLAGVGLVASADVDEVGKALRDSVEILLDGIAEGFRSGGGVGAVGTKRAGGLITVVGKMGGQSATKMREDARDLISKMKGGLIYGVTVRLSVGRGVATGGAELRVEGVKAGGGHGFKACEMGWQGVRKGEQTRVLSRLL